MFQSIVGGRCKSHAQTRSPPAGSASLGLSSVCLELGNFPTPGFKSPVSPQGGKQNSVSHSPPFLSLSLTFTPLSKECFHLPRHSHRICHHFSQRIPMVAAAFCRARAGAGTRPSPLCAPRPDLLRLPGPPPSHLAPSPPSLRPPPPSGRAASPLLPPHSQLRGGGTEGGGQSPCCPPGESWRWSGPHITMLSFQPRPNPAWPFPLRVHFSLLSPFIPWRSREGEDVTSSARHLRLGVPQGSPQASSPLRAPRAPLPTQEGCNGQSEGLAVKEWTSEKGAE